MEVPWNFKYSRNGKYSSESGIKGLGECIMARAEEKKVKVKGDEARTYLVSWRTAL